MDSVLIHRDFQEMDLPNYVNKEITFVKSKWYNDVCSRKTYTIKHWFKAIGLLKVLYSHIIVHLSVFRLGTTRGPRRNGDGDKYYLYQEFSGGGEILTTFLT